MVKFSPSDIAFIRQNFENYKELIHVNSIDEVLFPIDRLILQKGYKADYVELNELGAQAQRVHDHILHINDDRAM